jgi:hypothetical protein
MELMRKIFKKIKEYFCGKEAVYRHCMTCEYEVRFGNTFKCSNERCMWQELKKPVMVSTRFASSAHGKCGVERKFYKPKKNQ